MINILDTLKLDQSGFYLKEFHIQRTTEAYLKVCLKLDEHYQDKIQTIYDHIENDLLKNYFGVLKVRLIISPIDLSHTFSTNQLDQITSSLHLKIEINAQQKPGLGLQNFKWDNRDFWNKFDYSHCDDIISVNSNFIVTETSRFNLFFYTNNKVITPTLNSGCLNGVYRRFVLKNKLIHLPTIGSFAVEEFDIHVNDLNNYQIFVANSVRGILPASLI